MQLVSAELPDPKAEPELFDIVVRNQIHWHGSMCMNEDGKCEKHFPKEFSSVTQWQDDQIYPTYRRRKPGEGGVFQHTMQHGCKGKKGKTIDNSWVVPYSPYLSKKYNCHLNVEVCHSVAGIKYLFKYVYKGHARAMVKVTSQSADGSVAPRDEISEYQDMRVIGAHEAGWHLFGFHMAGRDPPVTPLAIHLENGQWTCFDESNAHLRAQTPPETSLTAWFRYINNPEQGDDAWCTLKYCDFPEAYTWNKTKKQWKRRVRQQRWVNIGRVYAVHPNTGDLFYLRVLLHHLCGKDIALPPTMQRQFRPHALAEPTDLIAASFAQIKTVNGVVHETFQDACRAHNLLADDKEWEQTLSEAVLTETNVAKIRQVFVTIVYWCQPSKPVTLWEKFADELSSDFDYKWKQAGLTFEEKDTHVAALLDIETALQSHGKTLADFQLPRIDDADVAVVDRLQREHNRSRMPRVFREEVICDEDEKATMRTEWKDMYEATAEVPAQRNFLDETRAAIDACRPLLAFLSAPGGAGKTFCFNAILNYVRSNGDIALAVAASGLAALLLHLGRTFHNRFKPGLKLSDTMTFDVTKVRGDISHRHCDDI